MLWAQLKSKFSFLFWEQVAMRAVLQVFLENMFFFLVSKILEKRIPVPVQSPPIYMRWGLTFRLFFFCNDDFASHYYF